jgi:transposase InsO family protein
VKVLRTNNDMEFYPANFKSFCKKEGIIRYHTIPHTPQQNGGIESMKKTIISKARCMLSNSGLRRKFWAEAASTTCHLINCSPSTAIGKNIPIEVWSDSPYDYS